MKAYSSIAVLTVGWLLAAEGTASAAWDNVFQSCCFGCKPARSSFFAPAPAAACCPTPQYQQRCYYQPYTAYKQQSYYEPVTTYRTSYYWESCTNYRYTSYYDPCTGCCQNVATPYTSYKLRSQCNAVQSYVQRCQMVPYTAYRQSCYMEPVVCNVAPSCPTCPSAPSCPNGNCGTPGPGVSEAPNVPKSPQPAVEENGKNLPPQNLPNTRNRVAPGVDNGLRTDRITNNTNGQLRGTVVSDDRFTPKGGSRIYFANASTPETKLSAQADPTGRFAVNLPAGDWNLYLTDAQGKPVYHSQISMKASDQRLVTVVSR